LSRDPVLELLQGEVHLSDDQILVELLLLELLHHIEAQGVYGHLTPACHVADVGNAILEGAEDLLRQGSAVLLAELAHLAPNSAQAPSILNLRIDV